MNNTFTRKQWLPCQYFSKDAANAPNINCWSILRTSTSTSTKKLTSSIIELHNAIKPLQRNRHNLTQLPERQIFQLPGEFIVLPEQQLF
jgi:hypothetical protein